MTEREFKANMSAAKTFSELPTENPFHTDFWAGYQRGLRRNYHGENFGTEQEHELWLSGINSGDTSRKMRGIGYREGVSGQNIQQALKTLEAQEDAKP